MFTVDASPKLSRMAKVVERMVNEDSLKSRVLSDVSIRIGPCNDPSYGTSTDAAFHPAYVGDGSHIGKELNRTKEIETALTKDKDFGAQFKLKWNPSEGSHGKYDMVWNDKVLTVDEARTSIMDANPLISAQVLTPWSVNWYRNIFKQPLAWSKARKFVTIENGTDPWAEVMSLPLAQYSGFASLGNSGSPANVKTQDVEVQTGLMTTTIINLEATYKLTIEEMKRNETSQTPWAGQLMTQKQEYANWVLEMLTDYIIYYGNSQTGTAGLFTVNSPTAWSTVGSSMTVYSQDAGATGTIGSNVYRAFGKALNSFLTTMLNKPAKIMVGVSPIAYNYLAYLPYSNVYNPTSALKIFMDNFMAGENRNGVMPDIEIFADPLLMPATYGPTNNVFNTLATDYMVITAPEIGTGPNDEAQPLVLFGAPLMEFVYPVIPSQYLTQYKMLRRVAGVFAPFPTAIQVYTGFGI